MKKTKHIQEIRECKNTFSRALTEVLNSNSLPKWGCEILSNGGLSIRKRNEAMGMVIVL